VGRSLLPDGRAAGRELGCAGRETDRRVGMRVGGLRVNVAVGVWLGFAVAVQVGDRRPQRVRLSVSVGRVVAVITLFVVIAMVAFGVGLDSVVRGTLVRVEMLATVGKGFAAATWLDRNKYPPQMINARIIRMIRMQPPQPGRFSGISI